MVAEAFEAPDVVAGLAADVPALFVIVRAEVLVGGAGVSEQGVENCQDGVAGGDQGFLLGMRDPVTSANVSIKPSYACDLRKSGQQIYTHVDEAAKRDAITRLNKLLGGAE